MRRTRWTVLLLTAASLLAASTADTAQSPTWRDRVWVSGVRHHTRCCPHNWLGYDPVLQSQAQGWADMQANAGTTQDDLRATTVRRCFTLVGRDGGAYGANIASGPSLANDEKALRHSPPHYRNLIDPTWRWLGIGYSVKGGRVWLVQDFCG